jgi:hypothetical protein
VYKVARDGRVRARAGPSSVCDDGETGHCVDACGVNCETDGFLFFV